MRWTNTEPALLAALILVPGLLIGCGDSPAEERTAVREAAEREFGRRPSTDPSGERPDAPDASDVDPGAGATDDGGPATEASGSTGGVDRTGAGEPTGSEPTGDEPAAGGPALDGPANLGQDGAAADGADPQDEAANDPPPGDQESEAARLLADADRAYSGLRSLRATFVQRLELPLLDRSSQGHGEWLQVGRDRFRMDFTDPPDDLFLADGSYLWLYQPSAQDGQVLQCEIGEREAGGADVLARILSEARQSYDSHLIGSEIVSGVRTRELQLIPRGRSDYREVRVWVADDDRLVRRFRIVQENETIRTVTLADLEPNVGLDAGLFEWVAPADAEVFPC